MLPKLNVHQTSYDTKFFERGKQTQNKLARKALSLFISLAMVLSMLPAQLYWIGVGLIFVPTIVMELSKAFGLIRHRH